MTRVPFEPPVALALSVACLACSPADRQGKQADESSLIGAAEARGASSPSVAASVVTAALSAAAASPKDCKPIRFARGSSSAVINGVVPAGRRAGDPASACYTLAVGGGQRAQVRILKGENVQINIPGVDEGQDRIDFTTRAGTYRILLFQVVPYPTPHPFQMRVAVAPRGSGPMAGLGAPDSCAAEIGAQAAAHLVDQCKRTSQATHPPCHPDNSCALIRDEIWRSCAMFSPSARPAACSQRGAGSASTSNGSAWVVGTWAVIEYGCQSDAGITYVANGTYVQYGEIGRWKLTGARMSWTPTEATGEVPASEVAIGRTVSANLTRNGADEMVIQDPNGSRTRLRRCP